jgi:hypothetical protein
MPSQKPRAAAVAGFAMLALSAAAGPAQAQSQQNRVQLQVFQVKVVDTTGKMGQIPITVFVDTPGSRNATAVCSVGPRLRDALLTHLRKDIYKLDAQGKIDTASIAEGARPIVENAVKKENVIGVAVSMDPPKINAASSAMFARLGCIGVVEDGDRKAAKKKK